MSTSSISATPDAPPGSRRSFEGTEGNELLTALAGIVLIVQLAALGLTIIAIGRLLWLHLFLGLALIGPLALKLASTGYRFVRYYTGSAVYHLKGPPQIALRVLAPFVVISTLVVMTSGVVLLLAGPGSRDSLLPIHKISFFAWLAFTSLHVLAHLSALPRAVEVDFARGRVASFAGPGGKLGRLLSLAGALTVGVILAVLLIPEYHAWIHAQALREALRHH